jgi:hypothetical protein
MTPEQPFSKRHHYSKPKEITIREDAPGNLRYFVVQAALDQGWKPSQVRNVVCRVLRAAPDSDNWTEYPNIRNEVEWLLDHCAWFKVYDIIEAIHSGLSSDFVHAAIRLYPTPPKWDDNYEDAINGFFIEEGIGWRVVEGKVVTRGNETFEAVVSEATTALESTARPTAARHLHEALQDLSRRPEADLPGAVYHAMGSLECIARDLTGDSKATLGEAVKRHPGLLPKPLDTALSQIWGYASNEARHVQEGRETSREEAELLVGLAAALTTYLTRKQQ